jgi:hypothetical protein
MLCVSVGFMLFGAFFLFIVDQMPLEKNKLSSAAGKIVKVKKVSGGKNSSQSIRVSLDNYEHYDFYYSSIAGKVSEIFDRLKQAGERSEMLYLLYNENDEKKSVFEDKPHFPIYEIIASGKTLRSFKDISYSYKRNQSGLNIMGAVFLIIGFLFLVGWLLTSKGKSTR